MKKSKYIILICIVIALSMVTYNIYALTPAEIQQKAGEMTGVKTEGKTVQQIQKEVQQKAGDATGVKTEGKTVEQIQKEVQQKAGEATGIKTEGQTAEQIQRQIIDRYKANINANQANSLNLKKIELQAKIALKKLEVEQNKELKTIVRQNNVTIISLKQTLRGELVKVLQTLEQYKSLTDLTDVQVADINEKTELVKKVSDVIKNQNKDFKTSVTQFRNDDSQYRITSLLNIAALQATRIDVLQAAIELF